MFSEKYNVSLWWLKQFFYLLPVQPDTKNTVTGFGVHLEKIRTSDAALRWFNGNRGINLAVVGWPGSIILDFDNPGLYETWRKACPNEARTYTERTPRGGAHVFLLAVGSVPRGVMFRDGVELKNTVLVYPSLVGGKPYTKGEGDILEADPVRVFSSLSKPGHQTPRLLQSIQTQKEQKRGESVVAFIKASIPLSSILAESAPDLRLSGGRWLTGLCPFHDDSKPSFFADIERNLWGCHACGLHGDVINLYAQFHNLTVNQAIEALKIRLAEVQR